MYSQLLKSKTFFTYPIANTPFQYREITSPIIAITRLNQPVGFWKICTNAFDHQKTVVRKNGLFMADTGNHQPVVIVIEPPALCRKQTGNDTFPYLNKPVALPGKQEAACHLCGCINYAG